jgi:hypothetical protein
MSFDPIVPNANQSPGLFPTQNNANFTQLKKIIIADHVFNDAAQATDGFHKQVTYITRLILTPMDPLPTGANAILYTFLDTNSQAQLAFFNGVTNITLTPPQAFYPIRIVEAQSLTAGQEVIAYTYPGFNYAGSGYALIQESVNFSYYSILKSKNVAGFSDTQVIREGGTSVRPTFRYVGNNLMVKNNAGSTQIIQWSLIINRISI